MHAYCRIDLACAATTAVLHMLDAKKAASIVSYKTGKAVPLAFSFLEQGYCECTTTSMYSIYNTSGFLSYNKGRSKIF